MVKFALTFVALASFAGLVYGSSEGPGEGGVARSRPEDVIPRAHVFKLFGGQSLIFLGTQDRRTILGAEYGYAHPDQRLSLWGHPAQLVSVLKFDYSRGSGDFPHDPPSDLALGAVFYAHYEFPWDSNHAWYLDWGGGAESINHTSKDLPLSFNGTITGGFGLVFPQFGKRLLAGLRYVHASNAGRKRPNYGQNQIQATIGIEF